MGMLSKTFEYKSNFVKGLQTVENAPQMLPFRIVKSVVLQLTFV